MSVPVEDKSIYKSQHKDYTIYVADPSGKTKITGFTIAFYVRETISGEPIIEKTTAEVTEIKITDGDNGKAELYLLPADTALLDTGKYYYSIWITDLNSKVRPILSGYFWIYQVAPSIVTLMRKLLGEAGEEAVLTVSNELRIPSSLTTVYASRRRLRSVEGVWLITDEDHTGTNYFTGGGFDADSGRIWLGTALATTNAYVYVSYTWESGINDDTIHHHLWSGRVYTVNFTGIDFDYGDAVGNRQQGAEAMSVAVAMIGCILTINGANVAQMGYNFRIDEFEIQTKLWGEGMIAEALFNLYLKEVEKWIMALGKAGTILLANRTAATGKYNIESLVDYSSHDPQSGERIL